ncbi:MAG TPA: hypothetical protein VK131_02810 [Candidatus Acidoferrales bacterium]|nr:hypothetical protein [Candidatus Acidoferrales bacterium]
MNRLVGILAAVLLGPACGSGGGGGGAAAGPSSSPAASAAGGQGLKANLCDYYSTADFQAALGLGLAPNAGGNGCSYRDAIGDTCNLTIIGGSSYAAQYSAYKEAAVRYSPVEAFAAGDQGFYSSTLQNPPDVWFFDFGFTKKTVFAGMICGGTMGSANPKPKALVLGQKLATEF